MDTADHFGLFLYRADELAATRLVRGGLNPGLTLNWDRMRGLRFETRDPDEEDLRSFLLTFRQFVSDKEPVFLYRIYNLCHKQIGSDAVRAHLRDAREQWKLAHTAGGIKLTLNGRDITPEHVADLWINGHYFHNDLDKRVELNRLVSDVGVLARFSFMGFLVEGTRQVLYVRNMLRVALREGLVGS